MSPLEKARRLEENVHGGLARVVQSLDSRPVLSSKDDAAKELSYLESETVPQLSIAS